MPQLLTLHVHPLLLPELSRNILDLLRQASLYILCCGDLCSNGLPRGLYAPYQCCTPPEVLDVNTVLSRPPARDDRASKTGVLSV